MSAPRRIPQGRPVVPAVKDSDPPYLVPMRESRRCRVCSETIRPGVWAWHRAYTLEFAHELCSFFTEAERTAVPGACHELTACGRCARPMYHAHTRPGPWPERRARCRDCAALPAVGS